MASSWASRPRRTAAEQLRQLRGRRFTDAAALPVLFEACRRETKVPGGGPVQQRESSPGRRVVQQPGGPVPGDRGTALGEPGQRDWLAVADPAAIFEAKSYAERFHACEPGPMSCSRAVTIQLLPGPL